jgi:hypothetical protein
LHIGGVAPVSHAPLRHVFVPVAGHDVPIGSLPRTSLGGMHTCNVLVPMVRTSHVYGGNPTMRAGQSAALEHAAVQPTPPLPQNPTPLAHSFAVAHPRSISTHAFFPPTGEHENPAGQSLAVAHVCVQCELVGVPMQPAMQGAPLVVSQPRVPVSSRRQTLPAQICPSAQSPSTVQFRVQKRGALGVQ